MITLSLRAKITLACFVAMSVILIVMYLLVTNFYATSLLTNIDSELQKDISSLKASLKFATTDGIDLYSQPDQASLLYANRRNLYYMTRKLDGTALRRSTNMISIEVPFQQGLETERSESIHFAGNDYRLLSQPYSNPQTPDNRLVLQVIRPLDELNENTQALSRQLLLLLPVPLLLVSIAGWWIASRAMRPVNNIISTVKQISIDDLNTRLDIEQMDEIGRLSTTFNDLFNRLDDAVSALKRFTADASHELRTPLTTMRTQAEVTLSRTRDSDTYKNALGSILEDIEHLETLTDTLLNLTRGDAGILKMQHDTVNISQLLTHWVENLQTSSEQKKIQITTAIEEGVTVQGDTALIERIIVNLLDNAINYTQEHGQINVSAFADASSATITICDNGPGIPDIDKQRIFERFVRLEQTRQLKRGTGLGLAIVSWAAKLHHGNVAVTDNSPGTCFSVVLPRRSTPAT